MGRMQDQSEVTSPDESSRKRGSITSNPAPPPPLTRTRSPTSSDDPSKKRRNNHRGRTCEQGGERPEVIVEPVVLSPPHRRQKNQSIHHPPTSAIDIDDGQGSLALSSSLHPDTTVGGTEAATSTTTATTTPSTASEVAAQPERTQHRRRPLTDIETALRRVVNLTSKCSSSNSHHHHNDDGAVNENDDDDDDCREYLDNEQRHFLVVRLANQITAEERTEFSKYMATTTTTAIAAVDDDETDPHASFERLVEALDAQVDPSHAVAASTTTSATTPTIAVQSSVPAYGLLGYSCSDEEEDRLVAVAILSWTLNQQLERAIYVEELRADSDLLRRRMWLRISLLAQYANCQHIFTSKTILKSCTPSTSS